MNIVNEPDIVACCFTSTEWGQAAMKVPMKDLPKPALDYAQHLCSSVGMCMEVMLTAYCAYAECVLKLPCDDPAYAASVEAKAWFEKHVEPQTNSHTEGV